MGKLSLLFWKMAADKQQKKPDLGLLEEDDEFEEFPAEDWAGDEEEADDVNVWEDNWDDDNVGDDFSKQLRAELEKQGKNPDGSEPMNIAFKNDSHCFVFHYSFVNKLFH